MTRFPRPSSTARHLGAALALLALPLTGAGVAHAQSTALDKVLTRIDGRTQELEQVDRLLADADPNRRLAAMEALLASGDPMFAERAAETGLLSDDARLRGAAVRAVIDGGGPFTMRLDLSEVDDDKSQMLAWLGYFDGARSDDLSQGSVTFTVSPFDEKAKCWKFASMSSASLCAFTLTGESVSLGTWQYTSGMLSLDDGGALEGAVRNDYKDGLPVPAYIDLLE